MPCNPQDLSIGSFCYQNGHPEYELKNPHGSDRGMNFYVGAKKFLGFDLAGEKDVVEIGKHLFEKYQEAPLKTKMCMSF